MVVNNEMPVVCICRCHEKPGTRRRKSPTIEQPLAAGPVVRHVMINEGQATKKIDFPAIGKYGVEPPKENDALPGLKKLEETHRTELTNGKQLQRGFGGLSDRDARKRVANRNQEVQTNPKPRFIASTTEKTKKI